MLVAACPAWMYVTFGICVALIVAAGVVVCIIMFPDEQSLRNRARSWRLRHPRT